MASILDKIVAHKLTEIAAAKSTTDLATVQSMAESATDPRDFLGALSTPGSVNLIAEVKKASPSKGIIRADFNPVSIAQAYADNGASCISVLTDENFFQGSLDFLQAICQTIDTPLLRKDFILDEYQVFEARAAGADAVLLIAECLDPKQLIDLHDAIVGLGMTPLVELYDEANVENVLACQPRLVGVNNRDLKTFEVDLQHSVRLRQRFDDDILFVSESGIFTPLHVSMLKSANIDAMLVGESLMRADDIGAAVRELLSVL